jgi:hypothetical protein
VEKNGTVRAFPRSWDDRAINAARKGITLGMIEALDEEIVLSDRTYNDGIDYKQWDVPEELTDCFDTRQQALRQQKYSVLSDSIINHISVLRRRLQ